LSARTTSGKSSGDQPKEEIDGYGGSGLLTLFVMHSLFIFNEIYHKYSSCECEELNWFSRSEVKVQGHRDII